MLVQHFKLLLSIKDVLVGQLHCGGQHQQAERILVCSGLLHLCGNNPHKTGHAEYSAPSQMPKCFSWVSPVCDKSTTTP